jgi:hypothetical protein
MCFVSITENIQLMFREIIAVYFDNHVKCVHTLCGRTHHFFNVKAGNAYSNYCAFKGSMI